MCVCKPVQSAWRLTLCLAKSGRGSSEEGLSLQPQRSLPLLLYLSPTGFTFALVFLAWFGKTSWSRETRERNGPIWCRGGCYRGPSSRKRTHSEVREVEEWRPGGPNHGQWGGSWGAAGGSAVWLHASAWAKWHWVSGRKLRGPKRGTNMAALFSSLSFLVLFLYCKQKKIEMFLRDCEMAADSSSTLSAAVDFLLFFLALYCETFFQHFAMLYCCLEHPWPAAAAAAWALCSKLLWATTFSGRHLCNSLCVSLWRQHLFRIFKGPV